jgi:hypothetical protein
MVPPCENLKARELTAAKLNLRLEVWEELPVLQRPVYLRQIDGHKGILCLKPLSGHQTPDFQAMFCAG